MLNYFHELYECKISLQGNGTLRWSKDPTGLFSMKSFYSSLDYNMEVFQPAKNIWIPSVPSNIAFFFLVSGSQEVSYH